MKFQLLAENFDKTVPLQEASVLIAEFQGQINTETPATLTIFEAQTTLWADELDLDPVGSSNLLALVRKSLEAHQATPADQEELLSLLQEKMSEPSPQEEKIQEEAPALGEAEKRMPENFGYVLEAEKKTLQAVTKGKVLGIAFGLPLVYFTLLLVLFMFLHIKSVLLMGGVLLASIVVLCWYLSYVIKNAQQEVLENEVTPEVFKYVLVQQLKEKEKLDKKVEMYKVLQGSPEALRLNTPENVRAVHRLVKEMVE